MESTGSLDGDSGTTEGDAPRPLQLASLELDNTTSGDPPLITGLTDPPPVDLVLVASRDPLVVSSLIIITDAAGVN